LPSQGGSRCRRPPSTRSAGHLRRLRASTVPTDTTWVRPQGATSRCPIEQLERSDIRPILARLGLGLAALAVRRRSASRSISDAWRDYWRGLAISVRSTSKPSALGAENIPPRTTPKAHLPGPLYGDRARDHARCKITATVPPTQVVSSVLEPLEFHNRPAAPELFRFQGPVRQDELGTRDFVFHSLS
jgi:hypothetical protein